MGVTADSVFKSLSSDAKQALLGALHIPFDGQTIANVTFAELALSKRQTSDLTEHLEKVAVLGSEENANLIHWLLSDAGWASEQFSESGSGRNRACFLRDLDADGFEYAVQHYNNSRLTGRENQESGFRLNDIPLNFDEWDLSNSILPKDHPLHVRLAAALKTHFSGKTLVSVRLSRRLALDRDDPRSGNEIQCNMSFGDDPVDVELNIEGEEAKESFSFLSRVAALINQNTGRLFVGCQSNSSKLRAELATALVEYFSGDSFQPENLHPIKVFPDRLKAPPAFNCLHSDRLEAVRVSHLSYRLYGASRDVMRSITVSGKSTSIYDQPDIKSHRSNLRIYRGKIDFFFKATSEKSEPIKRRVTLTEPKGIIYGLAFPGQRKIIDRLLSEAGLMDRSDEPDPRAELPDLARFAEPQLLNEARTSLGADTIESLIAAGFLKPGPSSETCWCDACGQTHDVREESQEDGIVLRCDCNSGRTIVEPAALDTILLDIDEVLRTIMKALEFDQSVARRLNEETWFLGLSHVEDKRKPFGVIVTIDFNKKENYEAFSDHTWRNTEQDRGIVLSLTTPESKAALWQNWKSASLSDFLDPKKETASFMADKVKAGVSGKRSPKSRSNKKDWDEFFDLYRKTQSGLGHYEEADRMLRDYSDQCPAGRTQIAKRLKREFPDHFA